MKKKKKIKKKASEDIEQKREEDINENVESFIPSNIKVLGMDEANRIILWVEDSRCIWRIPKLREIDEYTLIQIAGQDSLRNLGVELGQIKAAIAQISRKRRFSPDDHLGQGIWRIPGLRAILVLSGDQAVLTEIRQQRLTFREVQTPTIKGKLLEFNSAEKWIDLKWLQRFTHEVTPEVTENLWNRLVNYLSHWNFKLDTDYDVVAGMILATGIQGILQFRPHMWITGSTNTGKTALFTFLGHLWPYALKLESETSEAAIRQEIQRSCQPVLFDECEGWFGRNRIIKLLRSSTRGGQVIKGTPNHRPIRFGLHHIFWLASVDTGLRRDVDKNRFIVVELQQSNNIHIAERQELSVFGQELVATSLVNADKIISLYQKIVSSSRKGKWGRFAEMLALPAAIKAVYLGEGESCSTQYLNEFLDNRKSILSEFSEPDYVDVLSSICSATILAELCISDAYKEIRKLYSVGDLIRMNTAWRELELHGIKVSDNVGVFIAPKIVQEKLLRNTKWNEVNIGDILARIPDAKRSRRRVAGHNPRGIIIPLPAFDFKDGKI